MENVLVAGANGTTGKKIINLLKNSQYFQPVAMVRKEEQKEQFEKQILKSSLCLVLWEQTILKKQMI